MTQFKHLLVFALVLFVLCECSISAEEKPRKNKKYKAKADYYSKINAEQILAKTVENLEGDPSQAQLQNVRLVDEPKIQEDPCTKKHCGAGRVCKITESEEAQCVCVSECPTETDIRRKVCSNRNETWGSDCEIHRMRCYCEEKSDKCTDPEYNHLHVEYYGMCKQMAECSDSEMEDFPRRMREWLFNIMQDLADREELSPHFTKMIKEAETNNTKRWANAAVWKWCDLDGYPHDKAVSKHELFPIRAPLMYLEHCIAPFFNKCDANDDHMITLEEWGNCLGLPQDLLEDECENLRNDLKD
ncbi:SPARC [Daktulosphaira vitifoliae]|uniref:SPARC n=1 Tax=Daktulosphaira vitifoliae TaxID=58002 RepID=UPI0021AA5D98|nr:SPARC [Daktulosphaira vitifoliae]XP_050537453.1 SPARC [Daktulosphaira vitifoliae]XP_050537454.1 SPARC [Daktulosphaira vitifoliae]XP_050537455.1 SPARC [Daktulosphaira vitifoliae]